MNLHNIYVNDCNNKRRLALGKSGKRMLFVIGLNPSTATDAEADPTIKRVEKVANNAGFDGYLMLNLCSIRSTQINDLPHRYQVKTFNSNLDLIVSFLISSPFPAVWLAWGEGILARQFFGLTLIEMLQRVAGKQVGWLHFGPLTKAGHPRHPSRLNYLWEFSTFDIKGYIRSRVWMPSSCRPSSRVLAQRLQSASRELLAGSSAFNTGT